MADSATKSVDVPSLITYGDDLVSFLKNKKDINGLIHSLDGEKKLRSSFQAERSDLQIQIQDYQKKLNACKEHIDEAKNVMVTDIELERLQNELEEELRTELLLQQELRVVRDELNDLECQRISIEEQKEKLKKIERDELRQQKKLSMYASVTNIIPDLGDQIKISGRIVERERKIVEKFVFEPTTTPSFEMCNNLWKMMDL